MSGLSIGPRPAHPPPRRLRLGSDTWALLAAAIPGTHLPAPFRIEDGPALDAEQRAATERVLRDLGLLSGDTGDPLADLDPSLRDSLLTHAQPLVVVDSSVGLGDAQRALRIAVRGMLACGLAREQRPDGDDRLDLGPVEVTAMLIDDVAREVVRGFGDPGGLPDRAPIRLDAAVSLAAVRALADGRRDLAQAVLGGVTVPSLLSELAAGLQAVARVDVACASGTSMLVAVRVDDGWWTVESSDEDVVLRPVGVAELVTELASALAGALRSAWRVAS